MSQITIFDTALSQLIPDSGTSPVVPTAGGAITVTSTSGITTVGALNEIDINLQGYVYTGSSAQTIGATTATCGSLTLASNTAAIINILVVGADTSDFSLNITGNIVVQAWNVGAGAIKGADDLMGGGKTAPAGVSFAVDTSGNDIRLRVTGVAGKTYNWKSWVRYQVVS